MLIYSHLTPQKLLPIAKSYEYIRDHTDYCGLLDDPNFGVDIDIAIKYNNAITGDPDSIYTFIDAMVLSGWALDPTTIKFYTTRSLNNPVLTPYIIDVTRYFGDRYRVELSVSDCWNSPCNYFLPPSSNIARNADIAARLNYHTTPAIPSLTSFPTVANMAMVELNKIPLSLKRSASMLTGLTTDIFKNVVNIFNDDPDVVARQKAAIESGRSYRSDSISDVYTGDYGAYFDVSSAASDVLADAASSLGNCFRMYQLDYRYNPFDYSQNKEVADKSGTIKRIEGENVTTSLNGRVLDRTEEYSKSSNDRVLSPYPEVVRTDTELQLTMTGDTLKVYAAVLGGYYDTTTKTLYKDGSDGWYRGGKLVQDIPSDTSTLSNADRTSLSNYKWTAQGVGIYSNRYIYTPSREETIVELVSQGYKQNSDGDLKSNYFNSGFCTSIEVIYRYFVNANIPVTRSQLQAAKKAGKIRARVKFNNKTAVLSLIDSRSEERKRYNGTMYSNFEITADAMVLKFGCQLVTSGNTNGTINENIVKSITKYSSYNSSGVQSALADVQFYIDGDTSTTAPTPGNGGIIPDLPTGSGDASDLLLPDRSANANTSESINFSTDSLSTVNTREL